MKRLLRIVPATLAVLSGGALFTSSCTTTLDIPDANINFTVDSLDVRFHDGRFEADDDRVLIDLPGLHVDAQGDF